MSEQNRIEVPILQYGVADETPTVREAVDGKEAGKLVGALTDGELSALAIWWLRKNPALLGQVLSEEQREALRRAIFEAEMNNHDRRAQTLRSILSPKEDKPHE